MKLVVDKLEDVAEQIRGEYEEKDGRFFLKMEEAEKHPVIVTLATRATTAETKINELTPKINEFRTNNIELTREVETLRPLKEQFAGLDPVKAREALEKVEKLGKKGVGDEKDVDAIVKSAVDAALKPMRDIVEAQQKAATEAQYRADEMTFKTKIGEEFVKIGGKAKATEFIVTLAKNDFEVKNGELTVKDGRYSTDRPGEPLSLTEWLTGKSKEYDFLLEPSKGGGAPANKGNGHQPEAKPGQTILRNPTPQQLGENAQLILQGKVKVVRDEVTA